MTKLIVQGLIKLLEKKINIVCRKEDTELIKSCVDEAVAQFEQMMQEQTVKFKELKVTITVDDKYHLPDYIMGGIMMTAFNSKIRVDNTLDKRLELLRQSAIPEIRKLLFRD